MPVRLLSLILIAQALFAAGPVRNVIIDTDAGSDDLMAIAFLLARADINIEAITVANGLAHVPSGAKNILRLLEVAGREIPVYEGRPSPLAGMNEFPESWRVIADAMPSIDLPSTNRTSEAKSAFAFLRDRLANGKPVSILALGPLTNIAEVLNAAPRSVLAIEDLVIMGGAVRVDGNLASGGMIYNDNRSAEWNFYIDPAAAHTVVEMVTRCRLVPLDAANAVPLDTAFLNQMRKTVKSKLGVVAAQVLASNKVLMDQNVFYAWDPLAAVALVNPAVLKISSIPLDVVLDGPEAGRTAEKITARPIRAALAADSALFRKTFLDTLR